MIKKIMLVLVLYLIIVVLSVAWVTGMQTHLFRYAFWELIAAIIVGAAAGVLRARLKLKKQAAEASDYAPRHTVDSFIEHWGTGIGLIILIVSGRMLGFVFTPHPSVPPLTQHVNLHYIGVFFTLIFGCYFLADFLVSRGYKALMPGLMDIWQGTIKKYLLRRKWNDTGKYLSSQKSAFLVFGVLGLGVLVTGAIKTIYYVWQIPLQLVRNASYAHDIFALLFILMLIAHVLSTVAVPSHWRSFLSWFTGKDGSTK